MKRSYYNQQKTNIVPVLCTARNSCLRYFWFQALGCMYFIHQSIQNVQIWDFKDNTFVPVHGREVRTRSIVTAGIRRITEGNVFTLSTHHRGWGGGGYHHPADGGYPFSRSREGGRYPFPGPGGGRGIPPSQVQVGVPPSQVPGRGVPLPRSGKGWGQGYPFPGPGGGVGGTPFPGPNQNSIACTCYAAGGMPLAFMQEAFLVMYCDARFADYVNKVPTSTE